MFILDENIFIRDENIKYGDDIFFILAENKHVQCGVGRFPAVLAKIVDGEVWPRLPKVAEGA